MAVWHAFGVTQAPSSRALRLDGLCAVHVATRDAELRPDIVHGVGFASGPAPGLLTIYLPHATSARSVANLRENGLVAVALAEPLTHRTVQVKGRCAMLRDARPAERADIEQCLGEFARQVGVLGMPPAVLRALSHWPAHAVEMSVDAVFEQTPGPGAGAPLPARGPA